MKCLILLITVLTSLIAIGQKPLRVAQSPKIDTIYLFTKDTLVIHSIDPAIVKQYSEILEKTNNQLSLWANPYGIFFAGISILFTLLAVFATYIHFKQTKEYKDQVNAEILGLRALVENFILQKEKAIKTLVDNSLQTHRDEIGKITADSPDYKKLEGKIKELESTKKDVDFTLKSQRTARIARRKGQMSGFATRVGYTIKCPSCFKDFTAMSLLPSPVCPHCGREVNVLP